MTFSLENLVNNANALDDRRRTQQNELLNIETRRRASELFQDPELSALAATNPGLAFDVERSRGQLDIQGQRAEAAQTSAGARALSAQTGAQRQQLSEREFTEVAETTALQLAADRLSTVRTPEDFEAAKQEFIQQGLLDPQAADGLRFEDRQRLLTEVTRRLGASSNLNQQQRDQFGTLTSLVRSGVSPARASDIARGLASGTLEVRSTDEGLLILVNTETNEAVQLGVNTGGPAGAAGLAGQGPGAAPGGALAPGATQGGGAFAGTDVGEATGPITALENLANNFAGVFNFETNPDSQRARQAVRLLQPLVQDVFRAQDGTSRAEAETRRLLQLLPEVDEITSAFENPQTARRNLEQLRAAARAKVARLEGIALDPFAAPAQQNDARRNLSIARDLVGALGSMIGDAQRSSVPVFRPGAR